jgi:branched-chain amino acid transport system substrate-binding protein
MILAAIAEVAIDQDGTLYIPRTALKDALYATSGFVGITGTLACNETGDCQPSATIAVVTVEGGAFTDTIFSELGTLGG